jgi:hypothetical protein
VTAATDLFAERGYEHTSIEAPIGVAIWNHQGGVWNLTRFAVETTRLDEAFAHTYEEADLLEDWTDTLCAAGTSLADAAASFEAYIRLDLGDGRTRQEDLRTPQRRSAVRMACREEARRMTER